MKVPPSGLNIPLRRRFANCSTISDLAQLLHDASALHSVVECYPGISHKNENLVAYQRQQMQLLTPAQQRCISDFLNLESINETTHEYNWRNQFTPIESNEYHARYEQEMTPREYGAILVKRYAERAGIGPPQ